LKVLMCKDHSQGEWAGKYCSHAPLGRRAGPADRPAKAKKEAENRKINELEEKLSQTDNWTYAVLKSPDKMGLR